MKATVAIALLLVCTLADAKNNFNFNEKNPHVHVGVESRVKDCVESGGSNREFADDCTPNRTGNGKSRYLKPRGRNLE